jgi:hypothetical protein
MATGKINESTSTSQKIKVFAGGSNVNLTTVANGAPIEGQCARKVRFLAAGNLTSLKNHLDVEQIAASLAQNDREEIENAISEINYSAAFMAFW